MIQPTERPKSTEAEEVMCAWCDASSWDAIEGALAGNFIAKPDGAPVIFENQRGEAFCCGGHRTASNRALKRLQERVEG